MTFVLLITNVLTCSIPSMCASISWMTLASLSASSAERRPLLIFSAKCLMFLWASKRYGWSGWSSEVCLSRSLTKKKEKMYRSPVTRVEQTLRGYISREFTLTSSSYRGIRWTGLIIRSPKACFSLFSRILCCCRMKKMNNFEGNHRWMKKMKINRGAHILSNPVLEGLI